MSTTDLGIEVPPDLAALHSPLYTEDFTTLGCQLEEELRRFIVIGSDQGFVLARYALLTWTYAEAFDVVPYIYLSGEMQAGKTRTMQWLKCMVLNGESGTETSLPALWLVYEMNASVTALFDEVDTLWRGHGDNEWKRRTINMGYQEGEDVKRKENGVLRRYRVYGPKVLAGINNGQFPPTIRDRSIPIELRRKRTDETVDRWKAKRYMAAPERLALIERLAQFRERFTPDLCAAEMDPIRGLSDRQNEICEPLLAIAACLGEEDQMRGALSRIFAAEGSKPSTEQIQFARIRAAFDRHGGERIFTDELCEELGGIYRNGKQLSRLMVMLGAPGPCQVRRGAEERRGYKREEFDPLFEQHLGQEPPTMEDDDDGPATD